MRSEIWDLTKSGAVALLFSGLWLACPAIGLASDVDAATQGTESAIKFPPRLFLSSNGIALSQFPGRRTLSRSIGVSLTLPGSPASWIATSNCAD
jgi:hypothetical protein